MRLSYGLYLNYCITFTFYILLVNKEYVESEYNRNIEISIIFVTCNMKTAKKNIFSVCEKILRSRNIFHKASPLGKFFECLCVGVQGNNSKTLSEKNSEGDPKKLASKFWTSIKFSLSIFSLKYIYLWHIIWTVTKKIVHKKCAVTTIFCS